MKKIVTILFVLATMSLSAVAETKHEGFKNPAEVKAQSGKVMPKMFQSVPKDKAVIMQEGGTKDFCPLCGMTLHMYYKTNHAAKVDGKTKQYCSLHCVVEDTHKGSKLTDIQVVDTEELKFIDADKAFYVVGSDIKGTMTGVSKYAFGSQEDAETFAKQHGGKVVSYEEAYKAEEADFDKDSKMVASNREAMMQAGSVIYGKKCQKIDQKFATVAEAKAYIMSNKSCGDIDPKELQAVGLFLKNR
jgi:nitrous oxide reductase accessory protein NosL